LKNEHHLIPALDTDVQTFEKIVEETHEIEGIGGYKLGFRLGLGLGLPSAVKIIRKYTNKPIIYDHQKGGTDIPEFGEIFVDVCQDAGVDSIILFPFTGVRTLEKWVEVCQKKSMQVIVGGVMTHPGFLYSEGGIIADDGIFRIYTAAAKSGVENYVVPATRPELSWQIFELLSNRGVKPTFYSPGIGTQGGKWRDLCKEEGPSWHAIVGRSLYSSGSVRDNATAILAQR
jgi:orotidine-5'-phosphate decarboxylase